MNPLNNANINNTIHCTDMKFVLPWLRLPVLSYVLYKILYSLAFCVDCPPAGTIRSRLNINEADKAISCERNSQDYWHDFDVIGGNEIEAVFFFVFKH